ncbi:MAG: GTPase HflX [Dehalococcoidia bacterium]|nr:GTPase HflX [Dehalococcoidia bacterium]
MAKRLHSTTPSRDRAYLVAVDSHRTILPARESLAELSELARTAGAKVVGLAIQRRTSPQGSTYIGSGKLREVAKACIKLRANTVIFDDELSPSQQRNLEEALKIKVIDRTALILDIFAMRASTREGRLQVELAQTEYLLPRLRGQWSHLERMEGAIGLRGPGETQIETDRRLLRRRISKLKKDLQQVRVQRELYRRKRRRSGLPVVALIGYTNAGKTTVMRALSGADKRAENKLFATLDPITRKIVMPSGRPALLTDTVGFIQKLPTQLVASFRATLEELEDADVLLHVVDVSHPHAGVHAETVEGVLRDLSVLGRPIIVALNKIDALTRDDGSSPETEAEALALLDAAGPAPGDVCHISASRGWGMDSLRAALERTGFAENHIPALVHGGDS